MPQAIRVAVNPNNKNQRYVFWNDGRVEPAGTQPPPVVPTSSLDEGAQAGTTPISSVDGIFVAFQVTDWTRPSGYTFTRYGQVFEFGDAQPTPLNTQLVTFSFPFDGYVDFVMNPAADGQGYGLDNDGGLWGFGGSVGIENLGFGGEGIAHRVYMPDWTSKKYTIIDWLGRRHARHGAVQINASIQQPTGVQVFGPIDRTANGYIVSSACFYDNLDAGGGDGWMLDGFGFIFSLNDAQLVFGNPTHGGWWYATDMFIIDDGLGPTPLRLGVLDMYGFIREFFVSTPPAVTVTAPADPTTTTTRPKVQWSYFDPEGDAASFYAIRVFTAAQYGIGGFDPATSPATWETTIPMPTARQAAGIRVGTDLVNATYRAYVRATDSALQQSPWSFKQWVQNVTPPATPTMVITPATDALAGTLIALNAPSVATGGVYAVEYFDADDPTAWRYVRGGDALVPDGSRNASVLDEEWTPGVQRTYRTRQYVPEPEPLAGLYSATQNITINTNEWTLIDIYGSTGLKIPPRELEWDRKVISGTFPVDGRREPVVISGEMAVKSPDLTLKVRTYNKAEYDALETMIVSGTVLLLRDPFKRHMYLKVTDTVHYQHIRAQPLQTETTGIRHYHEIDIPVTAISRPLSGPVSGSFALIA